MNETIPSIRLGDSGSIIHFAHANGYPPEAYRKFLHPFLEHHQIIASKFRPLWGNQNPEQLHSWNQFADDMIRFFDQHNLKNVIGIGHSLGGVTSVLAAIKRPDLFSKLILLDPVIFRGYPFNLLKWLPISIRKKLVPPAKVSQKRTDRWHSKEEVYEQWRPKRVFQKFSDEVLWDFINTAIMPNGNGNFTLAYSKEWETRVYLTAPVFFDRLVQLKTPMMVVKGEHTDVIRANVWEPWQAAQPKNQFITFENTGHLLPFEAPERLARTILKNL